MAELSYEQKIALKIHEAFLGKGEAEAALDELGVLRSMSDDS